MGDLLTAETEVLPPSKTEAEMDTLIMQDGLAWLVQAAINGDPALTAIRVKAILGAANAHLRNKFGGRSSHRIIIDG